MKKSILLSCLLSFSLFAEATFEELIPVSYYGWLDQYSITDHGFVGKEACVPTSSTNAMTFMQNINPRVFGTALTGTTYEDWKATDEILISLMDTTVGSGTFDDFFVWGLSQYIALNKEFPQVQFSGIFHANVWQPALGYPKPSYIQDGAPTIEFLANALGAGSAVLVGIEYNQGFSGGGHELLFNGLTWDPETNTGTVYFVDPLDPSENYSPDVPLGPVKQTTGTLTVNPNGSLELHYAQYHGELPYNGDYLNLNAELTGILSVGGSFYAPYDENQGSANVVSIIEGFEQLDPTTAAMFPVLAVLNTTADLEAAFDQFDPSLYNNLIFSEEAVAIELQTLLNNNILLYRNRDRCNCFCSDIRYRVWAAPFENSIHQKGGHSVANGGYKDKMGGGVFGFDFLPSENMLAGCGLTYAHSHVHWDEIRAKSNINSYGAFLYGAMLCDPLWIDASIDAFYNKTNGWRRIFITSQVPFIAPIQETIRHKNHSMTYAGHIGLSYDLYNWSQLKVWPFLDLNYMHVAQSSIHEHGGGVLDLHIDRKHSNLLRSEIGLGFSYDLCSNIFLHTKLSYANDYRFDGKRTHAYFDETPTSEFTVVGSLPQNNLFCANVLLGSTSLSENVKVNLAYDGEFGSKYMSNEVSVEFSVGF